MPHSLNQKLADLHRNLLTVHEWSGKAAKFVEELSTMGIETTIIKAYQAEVAALKQQVTNAPQPPAANTIKDPTDLETEAGALTDLGLDSNGNPIPAPAAPATGS